MVYSLEVSLRSFSDRLVLLEDAHHTLGPVGHVLGYHEGQMATLDLLVVDDRLADGVSGPSGVDGISELVSFAFKHGDGDFDVFNRNQISFPVLADVKVLVVVGGPHLKSVFSHVLGVQ